MNRKGILSAVFTTGILAVTAVALDHDISKRETSTNNVTLYNAIYGYKEYKELNPDKEPTLCFDKKGVDVNGSVFMNFTCPLPDQDTGLTDCCNNTCCRPKVVKKSGAEDTSVTVAVTIVVVCAVGISVCMVLYCCCCQKRPGIHEGKLVWIKKKKDKIVYEEGGLTPDAGSPDKDNEDEEVLGFVYAPDEKGHADHSLEKPLEVDTPTTQRRILPEGKEKNGGVDKAERDLTIPLITIRKPSTAGQMQDS